MVVITKATFGDEFSSTDVMKSLNDKFKDGAIDVYVDSSIIPLVDKASGVQTVKLTSEDEADIKQTVAEMCGPNDQVCMQVKSQEQTAAKLKEKEVAKASSTTEVIKGRRLTVEYTDERGAKRTAIVPEGQQLQLGDIGKLKPGSPGPIDTSPGALQRLVESWWAILGTAVLAFLYASSIIITWMTFVKYNSKLLAGGMVAIAVFMPGSGFMLSFFGPFIAEYFRVDKLSRLKASVPEEIAALTNADPSLLPKTAEGIIPKAPAALAADMKGGRFLSRRK